MKLSAASGAGVRCRGSVEDGQAHGATLKCAADSLCMHRAACVELDLGAFARCFVDTALVLPTDGLRGEVAPAQGAEGVVGVWTGSSVRVPDAGSARARTRSGDPQKSTQAQSVDYLHVR